MPHKKTNGNYAPLPSTLEHSDKKAQDTYEKALENAEQEYAHDEARAHRVAWGAVKRTHEKVGDHWAPKSAPSSSDTQDQNG